MTPTAGAPVPGRPLVVVFNGRALAARALKRVGLAALLAEQKLAHEIVDTSSPERGRAVAEEAARAGRIVVAAGGDGTARAVASGLLAAGNPDAVMGIIPLGTGNDLATALGRIGRGITSAIAAIAEGRTGAIDVGRVNGVEIFLNVAGVGFDAEVARRRRRGRVRLPSYFPYVVAGFLGYRPRGYTVCWPGGAWEGRALMVAAMNGTSEGGGIRMAPRARLDDGRLDIRLFRPISLWQFARYVWAVRRGSHERLPMVECWQTERLNVVSDAALQYHLDGEYRESPAGEVLEIAVEPGRLRMIV